MSELQNFLEFTKGAVLGKSYKLENESPKQTKPKKPYDVVTV